ncbi:hypothetical protein [Chitinasiproducens palmae]|uniref:Uncharacterized protein n=1 Tax=Chitinasiproducens palmae TaxID=1770053 RepID=A0A1H2PY04_9BURK|nr:hypothetical protein [Chitinasiproducens palmae]SDV51564.1 hypothetical protein SAMN05216551_11865 [Chitinasiproducens palmae]
MNLLRPGADERASTKTHKLRAAAYGAFVFTFAGPLIAAVLCPALMFGVWVSEGTPARELVGVCLGMVPLLYFGSFMLLYFIPALVSGALVGLIASRWSRHATAWSSVAIGVCAATVHSELRTTLLGMAEPDSPIAGIDVIALINVPVPAWLLAWWLHGRLHARLQRSA